MTAVMDVAYLDEPHIAHLPRQALRVCPPCWEEACFACDGGQCICACTDLPPLPTVDERIMRLADSIGART